MEYISNIILNNIDVMNIYMFFCALTDKQVRFTKKGVFLGILCGSILGICGTILDINVYKLIVNTSIIAMLYILYKKNIYDTLILYILLNVWMIGLQLVAVFIFTQLPLRETIVIICTQVFVLWMTVFAYYKLPLYHVLNIVKTNIVLKCFLFILNILFFCILFYINFEIERLEPFMVWYMFVLVISAVGFWQTITKIIALTEKIQAEQHDFNNIITAIVGIINTSDDVTYIRKKVNEYINIAFEESKMNKLPNVDSHNVEAFIQQKSKKAKEKKIEIQSDIVYQDNVFVPEPIIIQLLGILLDNAMEESSEETFIKVLLYSDHDNVVIEVTNPYKGMTIEEMDKMFTKAYSTKQHENNHQMRGYGLYNLRKIVKKYKGQNTVEEHYCQGVQCITIRIEVGACANKKSQ